MATRVGMSYPGRYLMTRRSWVRLGAATVAFGLLVSGAVVWWTRPRVLEAGPAVVLVEGRDIRIGPIAIVGVGVTGTLGLVGGRCVGFVRPGSPGEGTIIVWPPDTSVAGSGEGLMVTSNGVSVRLGETIDGGTSERDDLPTFDGRLPEECEGADLLDVDLAG